MMMQWLLATQFGEISLHHTSRKFMCGSFKSGNSANHHQSSVFCTHSQFWEFFRSMDADYGDIVYFSDAR